MVNADCAAIRAASRSLETPDLRIVPDASTADHSTLFTSCSSKPSIPAARYMMRARYGSAKPPNGNITVPDTECLRHSFNMPVRGAFSTITRPLPNLPSARFAGLKSTSFEFNIPYGNARDSASPDGVLGDDKASIDSNLPGCGVLSI